MKFEINQNIKPLSASLKRLNIGKFFRLKDFEYELEENKLDSFWNKCKEDSGYIINFLTPNQDEIFAEIFIIGISLFYNEILNPHSLNHQQVVKHFNRFVFICINYHLDKSTEYQDYTKLFFELEKLDFLDKNLFKKLQIKVDEKKINSFEIKTTNINDLIKTVEIKKYQIFISSTYIDLKEERQAVVQTILKKGHIPAGMELFTAGDKSQWEVIKKWIDDSDIYVLLLGGRYGSIDKKSDLSYTELEYDYALEKKKPLFALILSDEIILKKSDDIIKIYDLENFKYIDFKEKVASKMCSFPDNIDQIKTEVNHSLDDLIKSHKMCGWVKGEIYNKAKK